jgi:hypothetical protein
MSSTIKRAALIAGGAAILALSIPSTSALAAPSDHRNPNVSQATSGCNELICISLLAHGGAVDVKAWVKFGTGSFYGHYELINPRKGIKNSGANKLWRWTPAYNFGWMTGIRGKYCVIAWEYNGGTHYTKLGYPCVTYTP